MATEFADYSLKILPAALAQRMKLPPQVLATLDDIIFDLSTDPHRHPGLVQSGHPARQSGLPDLGLHRAGGASEAPRRRREAGQEGFLDSGASEHGVRQPQGDYALSIVATGSQHSAGSADEVQTRTGARRDQQDAVHGSLTAKRFVVLERSYPNRAAVSSSQRAGSVRGGHSASRLSIAARASANAAPSNR